jgi:hypothetical protein
VASSPPLHDMSRCRPLPRHWLPERIVSAQLLPRKPSYLAAAPGLATWRLIAQMKAESSRATAVTATVLSLPFRVSAR